MLVEMAHRKRYFIEGVYQRHYFIALVGLLVAQEDLHRRANAVRLHLAEQSALLAVHAVHYARDVVDVSLQLPRFGVLRCEESRCFPLPHQLGRADSLQHLSQDGCCSQVLTDVVRTDGVVVSEASTHLLQRPCQQLIEEEHVVEAFGVGHHPFAVLGFVEDECLLWTSPFEGGIGGWSVESGEMRGDAGVQAADDAVEQLFLLAQFAVGFVAAEAALLVDQLPDGRPVVVGVGFHVGTDVEVLALVVLLVLNVPDPLFAALPLWRPLLHSVPARRGAIEMHPNGRDILLITAADVAGS
jgi:hypothetical protein